MNAYYWQTEDDHFNNEETMEEFLEDHLEDQFEILSVDGSYAEIKDKNSGDIWGCHASGNGSFYDHKIEFELIK